MNFMLTIFQTLNHCPKAEKIFEGLSDEQKLIYNDLKGPSWSPERKQKKLI